MMLRESYRLWKVLWQVIKQITTPRADSLFSQALMARVPKGTEEINRKALLAGIEVAKRVDLKDLPLLAIEEEEV